MPTVYHTSTISTEAEKNKYFHSPINTLPLVAAPPLVTHEGTPCLKIALGTDSVPLSNIFANPIGTGTTAFADMNAAVGSFPNGAVVWCFSSDSTKWGRYVKTGGAFAKTGSLTPLYEYDDNHMKVLLDYLLLVQSCFNTGHPAIVGTKTAYPNVGDMTNHIIRLWLRVVNFAYPSDFKLGLHLQGELAGIPRIGTGNAGVGAFPLVNAMNHTDILGQLGAGNGGIFADNTVTYIGDSGVVPIDIPMSPSDAMWTMMLGNPDKDGHEGPAYARANKYIGTSAKRLVGADVTKVNAYLCGLRWNPRPGTTGVNTQRPRTAPAFEPTGDIHLSKVEFIAP